MHAAPPAGQPLLLDRITHQYAGHKAVDGVTLDIGGGELVALLGLSGCGKTTLLRIVAGLVQQTAGRVVVGGQAVDALPPSRRPVGIVFQSYALFPHMTVADNVAYGLAARGVGRPARRQEAARMLDLVQLGHLSKEGAIDFRTTMHITKNTPNAELAFKLIEAALSPEVQAALMASPYLVVPTNTKVPIAGEVAKLVPDHAAMRSRFVFQDWARVNEQRAGWLERFNRGMRG